MDSAKYFAITGGSNKMGNSCDCRSSKRHNEVLKKEVKKACSLQKINEPFIYDEPNFIFIDYTRNAYGMQNISDFRQFFYNFMPIDVRCCREIPDPIPNGESLSKKGHSYVSITGRKIRDEMTVDELVMTVDFTPNGFRIEVGTAEDITKVQQRVRPRYEKMFMPAAGSESSGGFFEIMEWVDMHKDIDFYWLGTEPGADTDNLGKQIYKFTLGLFAKP